MPRVKITDALLKTAERPAKGTVTYWDTELKGFVAHVQKTTTTLYYNRNNQRHLIGRFPSISMPLAREAARELDYKLRRGYAKHVTHSNPYLGDLADQYCKRPKLRSQKWKDFIKHAIENDLKWSGRRAQDITPAMCREAHERLLKRGPTVANQTLQVLNTVWNYARRQDPSLPESPAQGLEWFPEKKSLNAPIRDLKAWKAEIDKIENQIHRTAYLFALFTGLRRGEIETLEWSQIDDAIHLPITKSGREFWLPLTEFHHEILKPLQELDARWVTAEQHLALKEHLFPGDGKEAVAILLCGRRAGDRRYRLTVREMYGVPHDECILRTPEKIIWSPDCIADYLEQAAELGLSVIKVHSHPTGYPEFSSTDDDGDKRLLPMIRGWIEAEIPHGSAVMRLGVGELVLVDFDEMEERNVNRILNSTMEDAKRKRKKVDVLADAVEKTGLGTKVIKLNKNLWDTEVIRAVAQSDVIIGCMDTIDGRYLLNSLATHYLIPYFDIGIRLDTFRTGPKKGTIREVCGTINYLQPGLSSLMSRGLFSMEAVRAAGLQRNDPEAHERQVNEGYIAGVANHRPAVISVNMFAASLAVNELLARLHPYREYSNQRYASVQFSLASMEFITDPEEVVCQILKRKVGFGDTRPLLGEMELTERRN